MKKFLIVIAALFILIYGGICGLLYLNQESILFRPRVLSQAFVYDFSGKFEEIKINVPGGQLSTVLFNADSSRGVIFYLHGNAGCIEDWGQAANFYLDNHYDVFMIDYPGYGKSGGHISSEQQIFECISKSYADLKTRYDEKNIIVLGYSLGTGLASYIASVNHPKLLVLQAPYYSMSDMMQQQYPFIPTLLLKYKFDTSAYLKKCKMPISIFHGEKDGVIPFESSVRLSKILKKGDRFIPLKDQGHHAMTDNGVFQKEMADLLRLR
jgi:uncharacterized protein